MQMANCIPGGAEIAIHIVSSTVLKPNCGLAASKEDISNAYNTTDRVLCVNETMALFPKVARWIRWMYGTPAMLMHNTNDVIMGEEGGYQGDANGGLIHYVGLQGALRDTAEAIGEFLE